MPELLSTVEALTCVKCSYSLRGLDRTSNCPECGHSIADSAAALPISRWVPGFRRALTFLMLALLIEVPWLNRLLYLDLLYELRYRRISINPEGTLAIIYALLALPASYLLTRPTLFLPRDPARFRKPLFALLITQLTLGPTNIICFPLSARSYTAGTILLAIYGILPV